MSTFETDLTLGDIVIPAGAARGITQTLNIVNNGVLRRTVNGTLLDLTRDQNRKFESKVSVSDLITPTLAGIWKGMEILVGCLAKIRQLPGDQTEGLDLLEDGGHALLEDGGHAELDVLSDSTFLLIRDPVADTVVGRNLSNEAVDPVSVVGRTASFDQPLLYIEFKPQMLMLVADVVVSDDEYAGKQDWEIDLEEV